MDLLASTSSESRFLAYVEGLVAVIGHADRAVPLHDYCLGLLMPGERKSVRADGGGDGTGAGGSPASIAAAFCRQRAVVGRAGSGQGARAGAADTLTPRANRGVDHRRYRVSEEGPAFGRS